MTWLEWSRGTFERARKEGKPVFLHLASAASRLSGTLESIYERPEIASLLRSGFLPVRVVAEDRPDLACRFAGRDGAPVVLTPAGAVLSTVSFLSPEDLAESLARLAGPVGLDSPAPSDGNGGPPIAPPDGKRGSLVGSPAQDLDPAWPGSVLEKIGFDRAESFPCPECLEFLLYAAREWKRPELKEGLLFQLSRFPKSEAWDRREEGFARPGEVRRLDLNARLARLYLDAHALTGDPVCREVGMKLSSFLADELFDGRVGAFRFVSSHATPLCYADANAMAAIAMMKCASIDKDRRWRDAADRALMFLGNMMDAGRGVAHRWEKGPSIYGLLGDNAWAMLAFTESFLSTGNRTHRELADAILKLLFQQHWEGEGGGFLDRAPEEDDSPGAGAPVITLSLNAAALEAAWRLHHLKGNIHYSRWACAALKSLIPSSLSDRCGCASLARIQDMLQRGRVDLELVGRVGEAATEAMLAAVNRFYVPRKIVSFVDPDDQDFILPHKLKTHTWPKLFGCIDLRPKAEADRPDEVAKVLDAIS